MADDNGDPMPDAELEALAQLQIDAMNRLSAVARQRLSWDPESGGSTDLFTKALTMRAETSALIRLCINAGVFTYREFVDAFAEEANDLAQSYAADGMTEGVHRRAQKIRLN